MSFSVAQFAYSSIQYYTVTYSRCRFKILSLAHLMPRQLWNLTKSLMRSFIKSSLIILSQNWFTKNSYLSEIINYIIMFRKITNKKIQSCWYLFVEYTHFKKEKTYNSVLLVIADKAALATVDVMEVALGIDITVRSK